MSASVVQRYIKHWVTLVPVDQGHAENGLLASVVQRYLVDLSNPLSL